MRARCWQSWAQGSPTHASSNPCSPIRSGCGKTTLLNVLAHREPAGPTLEQTRLLNGSPTSIEEFRRISCYVEQEEALLGVLTVRETLYFAAKLSLPRSVSLGASSSSAHCPKLGGKGRANESYRGTDFCIWIAICRRSPRWNAHSQRNKWRPKAPFERGKPAHHQSKDYLS